MHPPRLYIILFISRVIFTTVHITDPRLNFYFTSSKLILQILIIIFGVRNHIYNQNLLYSENIIIAVSNVGLGITLSTQNVTPSTRAQTNLKPTFILHSLYFYRN